MTGSLLEFRPVDLALRHPWTLSRSRSVAKTNVLVRLSHGSEEGFGEAAPNARYGEDSRSVLAALERMTLALAEPDALATLGAPAGRDGWLDRVDAALPEAPSARAALDIALHDLLARRAGFPLGRFLGVEPKESTPTSFSIGIDSPEIVQDKVREAGEFRILKVKAGLADDRERFLAIRAVTDKPLYVDANEGWKEPRQAVEMIRWMEGIGVALVEQPLPAADLDGARRVRQQVSMPIFADEAALTSDDLPKLAGAYDGVNVKLQKAGGLRAALRMIGAARRAGLSVMLGCMIETSIGITAAVHIAPLADHVDLDGHLLLADDPFRGALLRAGRLVPPSAPGLGVEGTW